MEFQASSRDFVPAKLLFRPDARVSNVERKFDALVDQLSNLALMMKIPRNLGVVPRWMEKELLVLPQSWSFR